MKKHSHFKHSRFILITLLLIFLFSFGLRYFLINDSIFHFDSVVLANAVRRTLSESKLYHDHSYSYLNVLINVKLVQVLSVLGISDIELALKLNTILFGSLSCVFMFLFAREFLKSLQAGIFAALLLSVNPVFLSVTTFPLNHALALLFVLVSYYLFILSMKKSNMFLAIFSAMSFILSLLIRLDYVFFLVPLLIEYTHSTLSRKKNRKKLVLQFLSFMFFISIGTAAILFFQYPVIAGTSEYNYLNVTRLGIIRGLLYLFISMTPLGVAISLFGLVYHLLIKRYYTSFLYFTSAIIPFMYYSNVASSKPRFFLPVIVPLLLFNAISCNRLYKQSKKYGAVFFIALFLLSIVSIYPILSFRHSYSSAKEFAGFINKTTETDSVLILYSDDEALMQTYTIREFIPYPDRKSSKETDIFLAKINESLQNNQSVYLSETAFILDSAYHRERTFNDLSQVYELIPVGTVLWENPHASSVISEKFNVTLMKIEPKN